MDSVMSVYSITSLYPTSPHPSLLSDEVRGVTQISVLALPVSPGRHAVSLRDCSSRGTLLTGAWSKAARGSGECDAATACMRVCDCDPQGMLDIIRRWPASHVKVMLKVWVVAAVVMVTVEKKQDFLGTKCIWFQAVTSDEMLNEIMGSSPEINHRWLHCWAPGRWRLFKLHVEIIHINYSGETKSSWWSHICGGEAKWANKQMHILVFKFVSIIKGKLNVRLK